LEKLSTWFCAWLSPPSIPPRHNEKEPSWLIQPHLSRLPATPFVLICLQPGEEIGDQVHANVDQFFRIGQGEAKFALFMILHHLVLEIAVELVPQSAD